MNNEKDYIVFSMRCAGYLMMEGCKLLKVKPNKDNPSNNVYFFPDTDYVRDRVQQYLNLK